MTQTKIRSLQTTMPNADGWMLVANTWTYASATTITVPSGAASIYSVGDKIRFKQGATYKYFYVFTVADTLLTVTGGSDYTVATPTAITDVYYSHAANPIGFPHWFNYLATLAATGDTLPTYELYDQAMFTIFGRTAQVIISKVSVGGGTAGSGATTELKVLLPFNSISIRSTFGGYYVNGTGTASFLGGQTIVGTKDLNLIKQGALFMCNDQNNDARELHISITFEI